MFGNSGLKLKPMVGMKDVGLEPFAYMQEWMISFRRLWARDQILEGASRPD